MSKSDKKANKAEYQRAMSRLEQTAAKLKNEMPGSRRSSSSSTDAPGSEPKADAGRLGHWRGEGSPRPFRDLDNGRLWGICAGIAPYLGLEIWVVRCLAVTAFIFAPQIIVPAYIIGYFVLDPHSELDALVGAQSPRPTARMRKRHARNQKVAARAERKTEAREAKRARQKSRSKSSEPAEPVIPARNVLRNVRGTLNEAELRLRRMEGHVTSGRYELQKELRKIDPSIT